MGFKMKATFGLVFALCAWATTTNAEAPLPFKWKPIAASEEAVSVRGNSYVVETASHDWNIQRAEHLSGDVFRFEVREGDQWAEDRESGENKERSELDGYKTRWNDK